MPRWWETNWRPMVHKNRISEEKIMSFHNLWWYKRVSLSIWKAKSKLYLVHMVVFCTFNNLSLDFKWQKSKTLVLHRNDIRDDNRLDNLFLWTQYDNIKDMKKKWRQRNWIIKKVKIWFEDVEKIKQSYKELWNVYKVALLFWVSGATISRVLSWKIWNSNRLLYNELKKW